MRVPLNSLFETVQVNGSFDAADNFIAEKSNPSSIVITADILLAERCIKTKAVVIAPNGKVFTEDSIGAAVSTRNLLESLRGGIDQVSYNPPFSNKDRSNFLSSLHDSILKLQKNIDPRSTK